MSPATKLALRRFTLRWLRKLVDVADDRLHAAEVQLRSELQRFLAGQHPVSRRGSTRPPGLLHRWPREREVQAAKLA